MSYSLKDPATKAEKERLAVMATVLSTVWFASI